MGCAVITLKSILGILNVLCFLIGGLMISLGSYSLSNFQTSQAVLHTCIVGITLGALLFFTSMVGCYGTFRESVRGTLIYSITLLIIMLGQIAANIFISIDFKHLAEETITKAWDQELTNNGTMAKYETMYECCGKNGPEDYANSGQIVPASCYRHQNVNVTADLYTSGCISKACDQFEMGSQVESISDWSIVGIEALTIIIACLLANTLKNQKRRRLYH